MTFHVEVTETAERDVHVILSWLSERSPKGAIAWYQAWEFAIEFLSVTHKSDATQFVIELRPLLSPAFKRPDPWLPPRTSP